MKGLAKYILQRLFGYDNYLFIFSLFSINLLRNNKYEKEFIYFLDSIADGGVVLDIGANIGITTVPLAAKLKGSKIYSFEPIPSNIKALERVVHHFKLKNVAIRKIALGERPGNLKMVMPVIDKVKMQGLSHVYIEGSNSASNQGEMFNVPVQTLDGLPELNGSTKITAIKIDVENFEYEVLRGAENVLRGNNPIIYCELWNNEKKDLTIQYMRELGYSTKILEGQQLKDYNSNKDYLNYFFLREGK